MAGLEGKLNAKVGDVILMKSELPSFVAGFVAQIAPTYVILSHESPFKPAKCFFKSQRTEFSRGDRTYHLQHFSEFEVLKPYHPE